MLFRSAEFPHIPTRMHFVAFRTGCVSSPSDPDQFSQHPSPTEFRHISHRLNFVSFPTGLISSHTSPWTYVYFRFAPQRGAHLLKSPESKKSVAFIFCIYLSAIHFCFGRRASHPGLADVHYITCQTRPDRLSQHQSPTELSRIAKQRNFVTRIPSRIS